MHGRAISEVLPHFGVVVVGEVEDRESRWVVMRRRKVVRCCPSMLLAICFTLVAGSASAQDCFLFLPATADGAPPNRLSRRSHRQLIRVAPSYQGAQPYQGAPSYQRAPSYEPGRRSLSPWRCTAPSLGSRSRSRRCRCPRSIPTICAGLFPILRRSRPARSSSIRKIATSISCRAADARSATASASAGKASAGRAWRTIRDKQAWPDWYPPKEMIQRQPELRRQLSQLRSGIGVAGGPGNPLGARAHVSLGRAARTRSTASTAPTSPQTIGQSVSSGCIRMLNQDVIDLYERTPLERQGRGA